MRILFISGGLLLILSVYLLPACGNAPEPPLDAPTRQRIDSIAAARMREERTLLDSQCQVARAVEMPKLMDSIRQQRLREIDEKLRTIPK